MRDAVRYLEKTKLSMEEISIRIGYNSEDHFIGYFPLLRNFSTAISEEKTNVKLLFL